MVQHFQLPIGDVGGKELVDYLSRDLREKAEVAHPRIPWIKSCFFSDCDTIQGSHALANKLSESQIMWRSAKCLDIAMLIEGTHSLATQLATQPALRCHNDHRRTLIEGRQGCGYCTKTATDNTNVCFDDMRGCHDYSSLLYI